MEKEEQDKILTLAKELREIEAREKSSLGEDDVHYIKKIQRIVLVLEIIGRGLLFFGFNPIAWIIGVISLAISKIIENTEIAHNVMHGQYDWSHSQSLQGNKYELGAVATADNWRRSHNEQHHQNTGIQGLDNDVSILRFSEQQSWRWHHLLQGPFALACALFAQWGVAVQDLRIADLVQKKITPHDFWFTRLKPLIKKAGFATLKDYILFPVLAGPHFLNVLLGNLAANGLRNIWVWLVIAVGHCVGGIRIYQQKELEGLPEEHWYIRQITSSANFSSGPILRALTGHLGYHIEHHLFPDIPARRYPAIAKKIKNLCSHHGISYNNKGFGHRILELFYRLVRFSFP